MVELYQSFCTYLQKMKSASANTSESYRRDVKNFIEYLLSHNIDTAEQITHDVILDYVRYLQKQKKSNATISRNLSSLRCFCKYLISKKSLTINPMLGVKNVKVETSLPEIMSSADVDVLLSSPDLRTVKGIRDKAMLEVLYASGIRVSELLEITLFDINLDLGYVNITGEEGKERIVPLYPMAVASLRQYLENSRDKLLSGKTPTNILFLNAGGGKMSRQGFWKIIKQYAQQTNIHADITPKILRHSFATHLLENGADLNAIKEMLGHTTISSTKIYTKIVKNKYLNVYTNCHPRAKQI